MDTDGPPLIWTDIETTGLDPRTGDILEIGAVITDWNLQEVARKKWIVHWHDVDGRADTWSDFVLKMHVKSGLLRDLRAMSQELGIVTVMEFFERWVKGNILPEKLPHAMLAGSSAHFDRAWLQEFCPRLLDREQGGIHYRTIDVSSIHEAALRWAPDVAANVPEKREIHRVFEDLDDSLALARYYRAYFGTMR